MKRVLSFLKNTINDVRIIGATLVEDLYTCIDAAYGVHDSNMKSHTGGAMSLGLGTEHQKSSKQKLNMKSSTEAKLVGASDYVPYNVWMKNFLCDKGYKLTKNILFQDNESTAKMRKNGRKSCIGNSRYVNIRYFFVNDLIDKNSHFLCK